VPPAATVTAPALATGGSLTGVMVMPTVATFESSCPSLALNVKLSKPVAFGFGV
jgi:hypothetical protein